MTRAELHKYFKVAMDKNANNIAFGGCPAFLDEEIDYWLNQGLYQEVSNKFTGMNTLNVPFEKSVKRIHDLEKLVHTDTQVNTTAGADNECFVTNLFNGRRMFFVSAILNFDDKRANINLIDHKDAKRFKKTYNNNPWIEEPVAVIEDNDLIIYYDAESMKAQRYSVDITYVKFPTKVLDLSPAGMDELPENVLHEVINRAVVLALEDIESNRTKSKMELNKIDE